MASILDKFRKKKDAAAKAAASSKAKDEQLSVQEWMPIVDINKSIKYRKDGKLVSAMRVEPINIGLLSEREQDRIITSMNEIINGLERSYQTLCVPKPVNLDPYLLELEQRIKDTQINIKRKILQNALKKAAFITTSGEAVERSFYILLEQEPGKFAEDQALKDINELASEFTGMGLVSHVCSDREHLELEFLITHPAQASTERVPDIATTYLPPQLSMPGGS